MSSLPSLLLLLLAVVIGCGSPIHADAGVDAAADSATTLLSLDSELSVGVRAIVATESELADAFRTLPNNIDQLRSASLIRANSKSQLYAAYQARLLGVVVPLAADPTRAAVIKRRTDFPVNEPPTRAEIAAAIAALPVTPSLALVPAGVGGLGTPGVFQYSLDGSGRVVAVTGTVGAPTAGGSDPAGGPLSSTNLLYRASTGVDRPTGHGPSGGQAPSDYDAGHIAGAQLGGSNSAVINFFPQRRDSNSAGAYYQAEQDAAALRLAAFTADHTKTSSVRIGVTYTYSGPGVWIPSGGVYTVQWIDADVPALHVPATVTSKTPVPGAPGWVQFSRSWSNLAPPTFVQKCINGICSVINYAKQNPGKTAVAVGVGSILVAKKYGLVKEMPMPMEVAEENGLQPISTLESQAAVAESRIANRPARLRSRLHRSHRVREMQPNALEGA